MVQPNPLVSDYVILGSNGELHQVVNASSPAATNATFELEVGNAEGGTFKIGFKGQWTAPIAYNAAAAAVQSALLALTNLDTGDVVASGGALMTNPVVLTMGGAFAGVKVPANSFAVDGTSLTGTDVTVTIDRLTEGSPAGTTEWLANVSQVEARISVDRLEVRRSGTRKMGYKRGAISGDGTITGYKVTSRFVQAIAGEMQDETNPPPPLMLDIVLDDPESLGTERIRLKYVKLWELPMGFNVGDIVEEAIPITFEDIQVLEEITGDVTVPA